MPTRKNPTSFGKRLASLCNAAGLTQQQLADRTEISRWMIAHYETQPSNPFSAVILTFAKALPVTTDERLGLEPPTRTLQTLDPQFTVGLRLWCTRISELPEEERIATHQLINGFLANQGRAEVRP